MTARHIERCNYCGHELWKGKCLLCKEPVSLLKECADMSKDQQIKILREAAFFYGNRVHYNKGSMKQSAIEIDNGERARKALAKLSGEDK